MLYQKIVQFEDKIIFGLRVLGSVQYKHIVLSAQIPFKYYPSTFFHLILIKLGMYHHWVNALRKGVRIRNSTPEAPGGSRKGVN